MSDWLVLPAFAKINLGLELLGRRPDGYWEISTVYQTVAFCDHLQLRLRHSPEIQLRVTPRLRDGVLPAGPQNLVWRALALGRRRFGIRQGVEVELEKNIPVARGLGGGSADAAVALVGLLRLARREVEATELVRLGVRLGMDVPFFFLGGRALGVGRGEEVYPLDDLPRTYSVLVYPARPIATRDAYAWAARSLSALTPRRRPAMIRGFSAPPEPFRASPQGEPFGGRGNDFEPVIFPRFPELARIKRTLVAAGAEWTALSGSGPTVFGLFQQRALAVRALRRFRAGETALLTVTVSRARYARALGLWGVVQR